MSKKTEIFIGRTGGEYKLDYVAHWPAYGQGYHSIKYLYKGEIGTRMFYFWYIKDVLDLTGSPEQQEDYDKNFKIKWEMIPGDIAENIVIDSKL